MMRLLVTQTENNDQAIDDAIASGRLVDAMGRRLGILTLQHTIVAHAWMERFLTVVRRRLLWMVGSGPEAGPRHSHALAQGEFSLEFIASLAVQCYNTDYAFHVSGIEEEWVASLLQALPAHIDSEALQASPTLQVQLAVLASYQPLLLLGEQVVAPLASSPRLPQALRLLMRRQVSEPLRERALQNTIVQRVVLDATSRAVRSRLTKAYPRWSGLDLPRVAGVSLQHFMQSLNAPRSPPELADPRVLVAGCGTGQLALQWSHRLSGARVVAMDIALPPLAYAKRQGDAMAASVEWRQGDVTRLGSTGEGSPGLRAGTFHVVEAAGVLSQLQAPEDGLRGLLRVLHPDGVLRLALPAKVPPALIAARRFGADNGYKGSALTPPSEASLRGLRRHVLSLPPEHPVAEVTRFEEFFSLSGSRELLFPVYEHQFSWNEVVGMVARHSAEIVEVEASHKQLERYWAKFPGNKSTTLIDNWSQLDREDPALFEGMIQVWVQKLKL